MVRAIKIVVAVVVVMLSLVTLWYTSCAPRETERFNPRVYEELEQPWPHEPPLVGAPTSVTVGSMWGSEFTRDASMQDQLILYVHLGSQEWQKLVDRSGFAPADMVDTPEGPMIFVSLESVLPLVGSDIRQLIDDAYFYPLSDLGSTRENKRAKYLEIVGMVRTY